jgi:hypothetical protein
MVDCGARMPSCCRAFAALQLPGLLSALLDSAARRAAPPDADPRAADVAGPQELERHGATVLLGPWDVT